MANQPTEPQGAEYDAASQRSHKVIRDKGFLSHLWVVTKETVIGAAAGLGASMAAIYAIDRYKDAGDGTRSALPLLAVPPWHDKKVHKSLLAGAGLGFLRGLNSIRNEKNSAQLRNDMYAQAAAFNQYSASVEHHIADLEGQLAQTSPDAGSRHVASVNSSRENSAQSAGRE